MLNAIAEHIGNKAELTGEGAGAHVVLWPKREIAEEKLVAQAAEKGVGVYGLSQLFLSQRPRTGLLLGYAHVRKDGIREGIRRFAEVL